jgi:energy-coupling factor transporter ATP-binding protein EcfA2
VVAGEVLDLSEAQAVEVCAALMEAGEMPALSAHGQHLVLLLSPTGAGKSTLVNAAAGCDVAKEVVKGRDVVVVAAGSAVPMVARHCHGARSLTCFVSLYFLEPLDLVAMDTPGSLDTRVLAVNIANAANLARAMSQTASVKVVLTLSYASLEAARGHGAKDAVKSFAASVGAARRASPARFWRVAVTQRHRCGGSGRAVAARAPKVVAMLLDTLSDLGAALLAVGGALGRAPRARRPARGAAGQRLGRL